MIDNVSDVTKKAAAAEDHARKVEARKAEVAADPTKATKKAEVKEAMKVEDKTDAKVNPSPKAPLPLEPYPVLAPSIPRFVPDQDEAHK